MLTAGAASDQNKNKSDIKEQHQQNDDEQTCGLWLAPSSIPNAGLGMYAGKNYDPGTVVETASWIALVDYNQHNAKVGDYKEQALMEDYSCKCIVSLFSATFTFELIYIYDITMQGMVSGPIEFESYSTFILCTNVGALANSHPYHHNIDQLTAFRTRYEDDILDRRKDPGAGGFTYYSSDTKIIKSVVAGEELFLNYGDEWGIDRQDELDTIFPSLHDYQVFEKILNQMCNYFSEDYTTFDGSMFMEFVIQLTSTFNHDFSAFLRKTSLENPNIDYSNERKQNMRQETFQSDDEILIETILMLQKKMYETNTAQDFLSLLNTIFDGIDNKVKYFIPDKIKDMKIVCEKGITSLTLLNRIQNIEWLEQHGKCLDNINKGKSSIRQAGYGAFSSRFIAAGHTIAPTPLFHINERSYFDIREAAIGSERFVITSDEVIGKQIMLNYCFGHEHSSLLLCMMSASAMINHKSSRLTTDGPNAEYRWSTWDETQDWLSLSLDELKARNYRGLSLDIIALRDIQPGEEIFIDYGEEWESAWENHLSSWNSSGSNLVTLTEFIQNYNDTFRTEIELIDDPYPANIATSCFFWVNSTAEDLQGNSNTVINPELQIEIKEAIEKYSFRGDYLHSKTPADGVARAEYPCKVLDRERGNSNRYTVQIFMRSSMDNDDWQGERNGKHYPCIVTEFPVQFINFVHRPHTSDQHLKSAFRHHIVFRDDLFPIQWKDI